MGERCLRNLTQRLLGIGDTPERTALAFSIGVFLGFSPFLGIHTIAGIAIAVIFRLNRVAILTGVWLNSPWWLVPYYVTATWLGTKIVGFSIDRDLIRNILLQGKAEGFFGAGFWSQIISQSGLLISYGAGSLLLAIVLGILSYPLALRWIRYRRAGLSGCLPSS